MNSNTSRPAPTGSAGARLYLREAELDQGAALIRSAARNLRQSAHAATRESGLLDAELDTLIELYDTEGCDVSELRHRLNAARQSLNRNLKTLENKGLISRSPCPQDARRRLLHLTDDGRALAARAAAGWRELLLNAYRTTGPDDVSSARRLLLQLSNMTPDTEDTP